MSTSKSNIWIVDDDRSIRWVLERAFSQADMVPRSFESADAVLRQLQRELPDAVISDIRMPGTDGLLLLEHIRRLYPGLPVIIMTAYADLDRAVAAYQGGAFEYLPKPFDIDDAVSIVRRAVRRHHPPSEPAAQLGGVAPEILGAAPAMQELFRAIGRLSRSHMTVLITGESGTGKELVARALHRHSPRAGRAFIALNTAAIPRELLESELFGHERGAFTGATQQRIGRFEQADRGTLFLDEIGDMPSELQTRLLRVLADGEFYRVGGHEPIRVDVRVVAATHQNLEARVQGGGFREDLFHRLNVIRLHIPPLRERKEDLQPLARHFLASAAEELDVEAKVLLPEAEAVIEAYDWPGNVRQLENVCRYVTVMAPAREAHAEDLPAEVRKTAGDEPGAAVDWEEQLARWAYARLQRGEQGLLDDAMPRFERILIETALKLTGGRRQEAARLLGWGRNTLTRKIVELKLNV
ncbi:MAG: nitrogen regulation protein NR(I) [Gammaproteobacteria bacterium]|nr:nitrogen regulation protein NR(I) [Gammaproteobacteria bacterium]